MRNNLKPSSFKLWRKRVNVRKTKHGAVRNFKGSPIGAFIDGDSEYINLSIQSEINEKNFFKLSFVYGDFSKEKGPKTYVSNSINSWRGNEKSLFGVMLSFNFKIEKKLTLNFNLSSLNEDFVYRGKKLDKEVIGINLSYRF